MLLKKIEQGKQVGLEIRIPKMNTHFWYSYAVQKNDNTYYVYESEINEEKMASEEFEYEIVKKFNSIKDVIDNFPRKYGLSFYDIHVLKGERIFNINFYKDD